MNVLNLLFALSFCVSLFPFFSYRSPPVFQHFDLSASNAGETSNGFSSVRWALSLSALLSSWHFPVACDFWQLNMSKALYQTSKVRVMQYKASRQVKLLQNVWFARHCATGKAADPLPFFKWKFFFSLLRLQIHKKCLYHTVIFRGVARAPPISRFKAAQKT